MEIAAAYGNVDAVPILCRHSKYLRRALVFATRFSCKDVDTAILQESQDIEVDLEDVENAYSRVRNLCQSDPDAAASVRRKLSHKSAQTMAIEFGELAIFRILLEYKAQSTFPQPSYALLTASRDNTLPYLQRILNENSLTGEPATSPTQSESESEYEAEFRADAWSREASSIQPSKLYALAIEDASATGNVDALNVLLRWRLIQDNQKMFLQVFRETACVAPREVSCLLDTSAARQLDTQKLVKIALTQCIHSGSRLDSRGENRSSVLNIL